jgi:transcriptional regulator with XRE-family HTH domain
VSKKIHSEQTRSELQVMIGQNARASREKLDWTQEQAAERIGISAEFYARIERGKALPSVDTLARIAVTLNISSDRLLGMDVAKNDSSHDPKLPRELSYVVDRVRGDKPRVRLITAILKAFEEK